MSASEEAGVTALDARAEPRPEAAAPPPHILVVDDATVVRMYYRQILEQAGYRIDEAINGLEGLEQVARHHIDLCVVDVNMPLMDGYGFLRALRRDPAKRSIPALMTTTESGPRDHRAALDAGANIYLVKPVPQEKLALYVAALLGREDA